DGHAAVHAEIGGILRLVLGPAQLLFFEYLKTFTIRAWHPPSEAVGMAVFQLDPAEPLNSRCRHQKYFAVGEGDCALAGQTDGIAFSVNVEVISVNFVQKEIADRHGAQSNRAVCACDDD